MIAALKWSYMFHLTNSFYADIYSDFMWSQIFLQCMLGKKDYRKEKNMFNETTQSRTGGFLYCLESYYNFFKAIH